MKRLDFGNPDAVLTVKEFRRASPLGSLPEYGDDLMVASLIAAAVAEIERVTGRCMAGGRIALDLPAGTSYRRWFLPIADVEALDVLTAYDASGAAQDLRSATLLEGSLNPMLLTCDDQAAIAGAVAVVGQFTLKAVPCMPLKQAVILAVRDWIDAGVTLEGAEGASPNFQNAPLGLRNLIRGNRYTPPGRAA